MPADLEKLAYDSALRALDKQERLVEELRARAGVVLAASSLAVSFLGGRALAGPGSVGLALLSIAGFLVSVGAAIFLLLPKSGLVFGTTAGGVIEGLFPYRDDPSELYRRAADGTRSRLGEQRRNRPSSQRRFRDLAVRARRRGDPAGCSTRC